MMTFQSVPEVDSYRHRRGALMRTDLLAWRRRTCRWPRPFAIMMAGETLWAVGAALEPTIVELP